MKLIHLGYAVFLFAPKLIAMYTDEDILYLVHGHEKERAVKEFIKKFHPSYKITIDLC